MVRYHELLVDTEPLSCQDIYTWGRRSRDRMLVGFTTTYASSAYHH